MTGKPKKTDILRAMRERALTKFNPAQSAMEIHASDTVMLVAKRVRDPEKFKDAVEVNLKAKRDFASAFTAACPPKIKIAKRSYAGTGISAAEFCRSYGFALRSVQRWRERLLNEDNFGQEVIDALRKVEAFFLEVARGDNIASKWTGDPENYTPAIYIESARRVMGSIDLDPASNEYAQKTVKAEQYFTILNDGLRQDWRGTVFLNPPYKHPVISDFIKKLCEEIAAEKVTAAVLLTNNNTDTASWHDAAKTSQAVCFTAGRINFYKAEGVQVSPTNGQTFFYFGPETAAFADEFSRHGLIMVGYR